VRVVAAGAARAGALFSDAHVVLRQMVAPEAGTEHRFRLPECAERFVHPRTRSVVRLINVTARERWKAVRLYPLQPLCERPVEILERHDVVAVLEARPADDQFQLFLAAAPAADGLGSRLFFKFVIAHMLGSLECADGSASAHSGVLSL
jgi:hypothetical protein